MRVTNGRHAIVLGPTTQVQAFAWTGAFVVAVAVVVTAATAAVVAVAAAVASAALPLLLLLSRSMMSALAPCVFPWASNWGVSGNSSKLALSCTRVRRPQS